MQILDVISKNFLLQTIVKLHLTENIAINAPYHNFYHALTVAENARFMSLSENLSEEKELEIIIAALFHDFDHSMGEFKDDINISIAIKKFEEWYIKQALSGINKENIIDIIKATQFPYVINKRDLTIEQKIIRDADMTQILQPNAIQQVYIGLSSELKMDAKTFLNGQINFINAIEPNTNWFAQKLHSYKKSILSDCKKLISYLND